MVTIKNINERYGDPVLFHGETIDDAVAEMQSSIRECGPDFADVVVCESDYEVKEQTP